MVWIRTAISGAGKYEVRQSDFETVTGYNRSFFHKPGRPVETISWRSAQAFIDKLNKFESKAGKLPAGCVYALPRNRSGTCSTPMPISTMRRRRA